jgi:hypothetical protein
LTNLIKSFSVPVNSEAARIMEQWQTDGQNASECIRDCIEASQRHKAMSLKVFSLSWALVQRGICPVSLDPRDSEVYMPDGSLYRKAEYVAPTMTDESRQYWNYQTVNQPHGLKHQEVKAMMTHLEQVWNSYDWRNVDIIKREGWAGE